MLRCTGPAGRPAWPCEPVHAAPGLSLMTAACNSQQGGSAGHPGRKGLQATMRGDFAVGVGARRVPGHLRARVLLARLSSAPGAGRSLPCALCWWFSMFAAAESAAAAAAEAPAAAPGPGPGPPPLLSSASLRLVAVSSARRFVTSWLADWTAPSMRSASCLLSSIMLRILAWGRER